MENENHQFTLLIDAVKWQERKTQSLNQSN